VKAEAYRYSITPGWIGEALAARLTGMMACWNHPVFFDYVDRWVVEVFPKTKFDLGDEKTNPKFQESWPGFGANGAVPTKFVKAMWEEYRSKADEIGKGISSKASLPQKK